MGRSPTVFIHLERPMSEPTRIPVNELRQVFELLLSHVAGDRNELSVQRDYFWSIPSDAVHDVYQQPAELTIGQVSESWDNLTGMLKPDPAVVGYGLVWLAEVLRAIGDEHPG